MGSHSVNNNKSAWNTPLVREFEVLNQYGIHARPAAMLVKTASRFQSDITVEKALLRFQGKALWG